MNGIPMKFDFSKTLNEQQSTFDYYKDRYISYELELIRDRKEIERLNKEKEDLQQRFNYLMEAHKISDEENERLNNIINNAEKYIIKQMKKYNDYDKDFENVLSNIMVILGEDK